MPHPYSLDRPVECTIRPKAIKQEETCIDCHKGIAHKLPEGCEEED